MSDESFPVESLRSPDPEARKRSLGRLRELLNQGKADTALAECIPALAELVAESGSKDTYEALQMLATAGARNIDLRLAWPALLAATEVPGFAGIRDLSRRILASQASAPALLLPRSDIELPEGFELEEVNRKAVLLGPGEQPPSEMLSELPCGVCGKGGTRQIAEEHHGGFGNTGGVIDDLVEIRCRRCNGFTIYRYREDIFP